MHCTYKKYRLQFRNPSGTSRGVLLFKDTFFLKLQDEDRIAYGECNLFLNLSSDDKDGYEAKLLEVCKRLPVEMSALIAELEEWPSIQFGVEMLLKDWENGGKRVIFPEAVETNTFTIPVNGLIWMGDRKFMFEQIKNKLQDGYKCIKLKIGAIDFSTELELMHYIRSQFTSSDVEIRVDANGAFIPSEALEKLNRLSAYDISYIEQPIRAGQWYEMASLIDRSPVTIALDEELIGLNNLAAKLEMMQVVKPDLLILKPALIGGLQGADTWKNLVEQQNGSSIVTSALESNIGLNALAQYVALTNTDVAQGLGTGQLYTNNFPSPYSVDARGLHYNGIQSWDLSLL